MVSEIAIDEAVEKEYLDTRQPSIESGVSIALTFRQSVLLYIKSQYQLEGQRELERRRKPES